MQLLKSHKWEAEASVPDWRISRAAAEKGELPKVLDSLKAGKDVL